MDTTVHYDKKTARKVTATMPSYIATWNIFQIFTLIESINYGKSRVTDERVSNHFVGVIVTNVGAASARTSFSS